jgi:ubiquinone/menaquinone biosynthesis C-methylase UbiE
MAYYIGRNILKLSKQNTVVVDINEWGNEKWTPRNDITFFNTSMIHKIPTNSVDMISAFHVLHHINPTEYNKIFAEFYRILSPNGFIVLYEHDCNSANTGLLIDLEHALYDVVSSKKTTWADFVNSHYATYFGIKKWQDMFESAGFKKYREIELKNIDNSFYMFFKKN